MNTPPVTVQPDLDTLNKYYVKRELSATLYETTVTIPKGFSYDGATIPTPLRPFFGSPMAPRLATASAFHDYLYSLGNNRAMADRFFRAILLDHGVPMLKANLMFYGVRSYGWLFFDKKLTLLERVKHGLKREPAKVAIGLGLSTGLLIMFMQLTFTQVVRLVTTMFI